MICKESTWNAITKIKGDNRRLLFKRIVGTCSQYLVNPNGNEHFLYENIILTCWADCSHKDPFEHWNFPNNKLATEHFNERNFNNEY